MAEIPQHVAIIMDGNGRWATRRGKPRSYGHKAGAKNVETIVEAAYHIGIKYLTVYAFSTENWKRSVEEVGILMDLMIEYLDRFKKIAREKNLRIRIIGDRTGLSEKLQKKIIEMEEYSKSFDGITLVIAFNYGARDDIRRGVRRLAKDAVQGRVNADEITEETISGYLDTAGIPDPDLLIRTGGEKRLSNFLMWQLSYAELYFSDAAWPDFDEAALREAVESFGGRQRRFGNA